MPAIPYSFSFNNLFLENIYTPGLFVIYRNIERSEVQVYSPHPSRKRYCKYLCLPLDASFHWRSKLIIMGSGYLPTIIYYH